MNANPLAQQTAKHLLEVYFGGNWTTTNVKTVLSDVTLEEAVTKIDNFNSIATLVNHISYYIPAVLNVLNGKPLEAKDELSFAHPTFANQQEWERWLEDIWENVAAFADKIETIEDTRFFEEMLDKKYGNYFRNLHGIIEHTHYHLGQIVLLKKLIREKG